MTNPKTTLTTTPRSAALAAHRAGFSLTEMLAAMVIVAVLAAFAMPGWQRQAMRSWRSQVRAEMIGAMLELEHRALATTSFASAPGGRDVAGHWPRALPAGGRPRHVLQAGACPAAGLDACVELRAVPQAPDPLCGELILRSSGEWLVRRAGGTLPQRMPAEC